jgi:hypothetical protein
MELAGESSFAKQHMMLKLVGGVAVLSTMDSIDSCCFRHVT